VNHSAAKRTLAILEVLAGRPGGAGLSELCDELALPKSIAHRLLGLLVETDFVQQDRETGRYDLTLKLTTLGLRHYALTGLDDVAQPLLERLAEDTGELARLAVVQGERLIWVAKAQGARSGLRYDPGLDHDTGHDAVLHATATGKAWLATLPEREALRIVEATGLRTPARFGPNAARSLEEFRERLAATRRAGYGEALEEGEAGTAAVAVAVRSGARDGRTVGTLSVAGPLVRFGPERRPQLAARLAEVAAELGRLWPLRMRLAADAAQTSHPERDREIGHERPRIAAL
jgi:DNA-binding IclR family transcriptional regulator